MTHFSLLLWSSVLASLAPVALPAALAPVDAKPGGSKKFTIHFDPQTKRYWAAASIIPERHRAEKPGSIRHTLALVSSPDLRTWKVSVLADPDLPGKPVAMTQHPHPFYGGRWTTMGYAVRSERYRYIEWRSRESGEIIARELYDHRRDPGETINRSAEPGYGDVVSEMALLAQRHHKLDTTSLRTVLLPAWNPKASR